MTLFKAAYKLQNVFLFMSKSNLTRPLLAQTSPHSYKTLYPVKKQYEPKIRMALLIVSQQARLITVRMTGLENENC